MFFTLFYTYNVMDSILIQLYFCYYLNLINCTNNTKYLSIMFEK